MRRLHPDPIDLDDDGALDAAMRAPRRHDDGRPWVFGNMVSSLDGAISVDGVSGGLGGEGDRRLFDAIRAQADVVLVGAATVRVEEYGAPGDDEALVARRTANGVADVMRVAIVTRSLDLDLDGELFARPTSRPLVITVASSDDDRRARVAARADVIVAGDDHVDLRRALDELRARGLNRVLSEGGPRLNGQLFEDDLLDELNLTLSPHLAGGDGPTMVSTPTAGLRPFTRHHVLSHGDELFLRYLRDRVT
ncbi:MAG: dihydrofolate reductase family protein [Actinomycetota bacterium]